MGMQCSICGKKPVGGYKYTHRGKAKYLGGVGRKVEQGGTVKRARVCVQCIRSGRVRRPQKQKPFTMPKI
jgi:large subunit ribosomal protein L28